MGFIGDLVEAFEVPRKTKGAAYSSLIFVTVKRTASSA